MAKQKNVENIEIVVDDGVQLVSDELNKKLTNNLKKKKDKEQEIEDEVVLEVEEPKVVPVKMVKILMNEDHKCCIGGEWYYLLKDKHYNVPENVKAILMNGNKLKPL